MKYQPPKGTRDIWGEDFYLRQEIANQILSVTEKYGFRQVQSPMIESMELLAKDAGEEVTDQIYEVKDKAGRLLGLKSDITPPLARIIANYSKNMPKPIKLSCYDRVYRYERPQKGRYREIWQINAELFGAPTGLADAELLTCFYDCYQQLGLNQVVIQIGFRPLLEGFIASLGVSGEDVLAVMRLIDKREKVSPDDFMSGLKKLGLSITNIEKVNTFINLAGAPKAIIKKAKLLLKSQSQLLSYLQQIEFIFGFLDDSLLKNFKVNLGLARGSEYYTGIIFEAKIEDEQSWSIGGGGRYDNLIAQYSNFSTPAIGFSIGIDRVELVLKKLGLKTKLNNCLPQVNYYIATKNKSLRKEAMRLAQKLRTQGKNVELDLLSKSLSNQLSYAKKINAQQIIVVGHSCHTMREWSDVTS